MSYLPIENYGIIGDYHTVALVGLNGSIDWLCFPKFDAPSVFGAILDDQKGGYFQIAPAEVGLTAKQMYLPDTNILITRFFSSNGLAEITDFMPVEDDTHHTWNHRLVRRVEMICQPAFNYARDSHEVEKDETQVVFRSRELTLGLSSDRPIEIKEKAAVSVLTLQAGDTFVLHRVEQGGQAEKSLDPKEVGEVFQETVDFWRNWLAQVLIRDAGVNWSTARPWY